MSPKQNYAGLNIIFHHPGHITASGLSGSQVRPFRILNAFRALGVNVEIVAGTLAERKKAIKRIKIQIKNGYNFDFVYSENRTIPFAMTETHRLPLHPLTDHLFLYFCHRKGITVSLFYRDVFWRFPAYKTMLPLAARLVTIPLYWFDWYLHRQYVHTQFLPSLAMQESIPHKGGIKKIMALPPGSPAQGFERKYNSLNAHQILRLLYIGGVQPPTYDLEPILKVVEATPSCFLTLCCRRQEWKRFSTYYQSLMGERIKVVHESGDGLNELYQDSDIMLLLRKPDRYLDFAVPVKLFESVGYGLPVMASHHSEAGRIVEEFDLGWSTTLSSAPQLLEHLANNRDELVTKTRGIDAKKIDHTWEARASYVCLELTSPKQF
jgi:hypothetical protein